MKRKSYTQPFLQAYLLRHVLFFALGIWSYAAVAQPTCPSSAQTVALNASCQASLPNYATAGVTQTPLAGTILTGVGTTVVTLTQGANSCTFNVIRVDPIPPSISCPSNQTIYLDGTTCSVQLPAYSPTSFSDNCGTPSVSQNPFPGTTYNAPTSFLVALIANDGTNSTSCTFTVNVVDNTPPTITCPAAQNVTVNGSCNATLGDYRSLATKTDACCSSVNISISQSPAPNSTVNGGLPTVVTLTATDCNNNTNTCAFNVTKTDNQAPNISCSGSKTAVLTANNCTATMANYISAYNVTFTDNCPGNVTITASPAVITGVGNTTVTFTATDASNNTDQCTVFVQTLDQTPPSLTCPGTQTIILSSNFCDGNLADYTPNATSSDVCSAVTLQQNPPVGSSVFNTGTTVVTLTSRDASNNTTTCSFSVNRVDNTPPEITCPITQSVVLSSSCSVNLPAYSETAKNDVCCTAAGVTVSQSPAAGTLVTGSSPTTVTLTATDCNGRTNSCSFLVNKTDNVLPTITCPGTQTLSLGTSCSTNLPAYSPTSSSDNCGAPAIDQTPAAGTSVSGIGFSTVSLRATDANGNTATCFFSVNKVDATPPVIVCPGTQTLTVNANCTVNLPTFTPVSVSDNCSSFSYTQSPPAGTTVSGLVVTVVTFTATDVYNNTSSCSFNVNKTDNNIQPIICPANNQPLFLGNNCLATLPVYQVPVNTDNCGTPVYNQSPAAGTIVSGIGTMTVTITATDGSSNTSTCSFTVNKIDGAPPSISCPGNTTVSLGATCSASLPAFSPTSISDNCSGSTTFTQSPAANTSLSGTGTTIVTLTANDGYGNTNTCTLTVTRVDNIAPSITCPVTQTIALSASCAATLPAYNAASRSDNCGTPAVAQLPASGLALSGVGTTVVTLTATDGSNNTASCSFNVNRVDNIAPSITCPGNQTIALNAGCTANLPAYSPATMSDNCAAPPASTQLPAPGSTVSGVGSTTVTLTANDGNGNTATCSFSVTRTDPIAPTIICPTTQTIVLNTSCAANLPAYSPATISDNCSTPALTQAPALGTQVTGVGNTTVTLTANDGNGNTASCSFTVNRVDNIAPSVTCPGTQTVLLNTSCSANLPAYNAVSSSDNCGTPSVSQSPAIGATVTGVGSTTVTLTANDGNGNTTTCSFTVNRVDNIAPAVNCPANQALTLGTSCTATLPAYSPVSSTDNCSTPSMLQTPTPGTTLNGVGSTTVTLTANDGNGNTGTCSFNVTVSDSTAPTITCPGAQTIQLGSTCATSLPAYNPATIADNCGTPAFTQLPAAGTTLNGVGTTTVTLSTNDGNGNSNSCNFSVQVVDNQPPVISGCPQSFITCSTTAVWTAPTAGDNCGTPTLTSNFSPGTAVGTGTTTVVYTATDAVGNTATCSFNVTLSQLAATTTTSGFNGFGVSCNGSNNGSASVLATGGITPYAYLWSTGSTSNGISGVSAGTYFVTVTDGVGCSTVKTVNINQPSVLNCNAQGVNITCFGAVNGAANSTASGGVGPYAFAWSGPAGPAGNGSSLNGLTAGTYAVTVTDANGCSCTNAATVIEPPQVEPLSGTINIDEGIGIINPSFYNINTITFSGGLPPYNYAWNNSGYAVYSVPSPGNITVVYGDNSVWSITITDSNGCGEGVLVFNSSPAGTDPGLLNISVYTVQPDFGISNGSLSITAQGGTTCPGGDYQYQWEGPAAWTGAPSAATNAIDNLPSGWYVVTVTDCSNPIQNTVGWYWVPQAIRGRGKTDFTNDLLQVMPNPFSQNTQIAFTWPQDDELCLELYDITGKLVQTLFKGAVHAGESNTIHYDAAQLPNGLYVCRLANNQGVEVHNKLMHVQVK
ncbi:HYR domain-containing protein [Sphingobacteriales bacterium UPWRP_1]|nr:hypothetical protein BVG80_04095 [Sphingobacteriales bacterium TSM_CSM]PSJ75735.1 HYR domain-containing protein [Sphingobacteriales bacterium UPWRP_1]